MVTSVLLLLIVSHLILKCMGTKGAKAIVMEFKGAQAAIHIHNFHPTIGVLLASPLSECVDQYILGFISNSCIG